MPEEDGLNRALEITISEKVYARLKTQILVVYLVSVVVGLLLGISLVMEHRSISDLTQARVSEYRLFVAEKLVELHQLDADEVAIRTRPVTECETPLPREDAEALLAEELDRLPGTTEVEQLLEKAADFGVCDIGEVHHTLEDPVNTARVDTVYRVLLHREPDPIGRFIYGYWLGTGIGVEAVARDIMMSPEFQKLRKLSES